MASVTTTWRTQAARRRAWVAGLAPRFYVVDLDGTLVTTHSEKEGAAPNYKRGLGFYPLLAFLDATGEPLAGRLRPGNAGSGTADHIAVLDAGLAEPWWTHRRRRASSARTRAGCSHQFLTHRDTHSARFMVGPLPPGSWRRW